MNYFAHFRGEGARQNISVCHLVEGGGERGLGQHYVLHNHYLKAKFHINLHKSVGTLIK